MTKRGRAYRKVKSIRQRVHSLRSVYDVLVNERDYVAAYLGKWHMPSSLYYSSRSKKVKHNEAANERQPQDVPVFAFNQYRHQTQQFVFREQGFPFGAYQGTLKFLLKRDKVDVRYRDGQQLNTFSSYPYDPIPIDRRYGRETAELTPEERAALGYVSAVGRDSLPENYTLSALSGREALLALDQLIANSTETSRPFSLAVHFQPPHTPFVATSSYMNYYHRNRERLYVPPSIKDTGTNSAYRRSASSTNGWNETKNIAELTSIYYAMIEEIDHYTGRILDKLENAGLAENTLVIFTSDHGEMLGAHGLQDKFMFYEEAVRVPFVMRFPGRIPAGMVVKEPVSQLDLFSTILDLLGASEFDSSDGESLRRHIMGTSYNRYYDETTVVAQIERRYFDGKTMVGAFAGTPNFLIRRGPFKLMLPRHRDSGILDVLYDLSKDPAEMHNLLGQRGNLANDDVIGKVEHLKALLVEWLMRKDGSNGYFSDPEYNMNIGDGDIEEIRNRRTWRHVDFWRSEGAIVLGTPALKDGKYVRREYLYVGRTKPGILVIRDVTIKGDDASFFTVDTSQAVVKQNEHVRIKVSFSSASVPSASLSAYIQFRSNLEEGKLHKIKIVCSI